MKKFYKMASIACLGLMLSTQNINAQTVSDFENLTLSPNTYFDGSDMSGIHNNYQFTSTFTSGDGSFLNVYDTTYGAIYGYMIEGFAYSNKLDSSTTGEGYSSYAYGTPMGDNYAIGKSGSKIILTGSTKGTTLTGVYVTNSTYSAISMRDGDYFGKQFGDSLAAPGYSSISDGTNGEDWFLLTVKGYFNGNATTNNVEFYLADYRFSNNVQDYILDTWQWVDLSPLGNVDSVEFLLSSSDTTGGFGMNTPSFFALDDFNGVSTAIKESSTLNLITIYPNPTQNIINVNLEKAANQLSVVDITGKTLITATNLQEGINQIDATQLANGIYFIKVNNNVQRFIKN